MIHFHRKQLFSVGNADSDYWDEIGLMLYKSKTKFCEMATSEELLAVTHTYKQKGLPDTHTYMSYQIVECSERLKGCAPTDD